VVDIRIPRLKAYGGLRGCQCIVPPPHGSERRRPGEVARREPGPEGDGPVRRNECGFRKF
jgi:hypothetical protein